MFIFLKDRWVNFSLLLLVDVEWLQPRRLSCVQNCGQQAESNRLEVRFKQVWLQQDVLFQSCLARVASAYLLIRLPWLRLKDE